MPTYWSSLNNRRAFAGFVRAANPGFERVLRSSLRPLIEELKREPDPQTQAWRDNVIRHIRSMKNERDGTYRTKANKYKDALYHLVQEGNIPGFQPADYTVGGIDATKAYSFPITPVSPNFDPSRPHPKTPGIQRLTPNAGWVGPHSMTVEDYVARGNSDGIFIIHMQGNEAAFDMKFDGWTSKQHMNSVLRVAKRRGVPIYALNMGAGDTCLDEENNYTAGLRTTGHNPESHSGQQLANFRLWLAGKANVVVMGFDATVCVDANLFGTAEYIEAVHGVGAQHVYAAMGRIVRLRNQQVRFVKPLVSVANVVTSRALLATGNQLIPFTNVGQWGNLYGM